VPFDPTIHELPDRPPHIPQIIGRHRRRPAADIDRAGAGEGIPLAMDS